MHSVVRGVVVPWSRTPPEPGPRRIDSRLRKGAWLQRSFTLSTTCHAVARGSPELLAKAARRRRINSQLSTTDYRLSQTTQLLPQAACRAHPPDSPVRHSKGFHPHEQDRDPAQCEASSAFHLRRRSYSR